MLDSIVGQDRIKESLKINLGASMIQNIPLAHSLFLGPAGLGKTTLVNAVADELKVDIEITNGANLKTVKNILPLLMRVKYRSILFIDEIHACSNNVFNYLLTAMSEYIVNVGDITQKIPSFTLIGATTNAGMLIKPLRDRFVFQYSLENYSQDELVEISKRNIKEYSISFTDEAIVMLIGASRKNPRLLKNRIKFLANYACHTKKVVINEEDVDYCFGLDGIRLDGMTNDDLNYMAALKKCQPAGLDTLVSITNISKDQIEEMIEPYLLECGYIRKTPRGRTLVKY